MFIMHFSNVYNNAVQTFDNERIKPAYTQFLNILAKQELTLRPEFIKKDNETVNHRRLSILYFDIGNPTDIDTFKYRLQSQHTDTFYIREAIEGMYAEDIPHSFSYSCFNTNIRSAVADIMSDADDEKIREINDITCSDDKITFCHQNKVLGTIRIENKSRVQRPDNKLIKRVSTALKGLTTKSTAEVVLERFSRLPGLSRVVVNNEDLLARGDGYPLLNSSNDWVNHYKNELTKICNEKVSRKIAQEVFLHAFKIQNWHALKAVESSASNTPVVVIKLQKSSSVDYNNIRVGSGTNQAQPTEYLYFNNHNDVYAYYEAFMQEQKNQCTLSINPCGTPNLVGNTICFISFKGGPYPFDKEWFYRRFKSPKILEQVKAMADEMQKNTDFNKKLAGNIALEGNYLWDRDINGYRVVLMEKSTYNGPTLSIQTRKDSFSLDGAELDILSFRRNEAGDITLCRDANDDRVALTHLGDEGIRTLFKWIDFPLDPDELIEESIGIDLAVMMKQK
jgi:hypothetical protein